MAHKKSHHKKRHHHVSMHDREVDRENLKHGRHHKRGHHGHHSSHHEASYHKAHTPHHSPSVERNVVERGGQRGHMMQSDARHENAFGSMSFDHNAVAGLPRGVRMQEYPHVGIFLSLDDNLGGSREGIDAQMMEDSRQLHKQIKPRKI